MADRNLTPPVQGETRTGTDSPGVQGGLYVANGNAAERQLNPGQPTPVIDAKLPTCGSWIALQGVNNLGVGCTWYLFVTFAGQLRIDDVIPTNTETDGGPV